MKYVGFHEPSELPIKRGDMVTIRKGVIIKTVGRDLKLAGKTYKVKVDHILPGSSNTEHVWDEGSRSYKQVLIPLTSPLVVWAGPGGYWSHVDINEIPEAG